MFSSQAARSRPSLSCHAPKHNARCMVATIAADREVTEKVAHAVEEIEEVAAGNVTGLAERESRNAPG